MELAHTDRTLVQTQIKLLTWRTGHWCKHKYSSSCDGPDTCTNTNAVPHVTDRTLVQTQMQLLAWRTGHSYRHKYSSSRDGPGTSTNTNTAPHVDGPDTRTNTNIARHVTDRTLVQTQMQLLTWRTGHLYRYKFSSSLWRTGHSYRHKYSSSRDGPDTSTNPYIVPHVTGRTLVQIQIQLLTLTDRTLVQTQMQLLTWRTGH